MKVTIAFKHMEHTPSLDERINEKSNKIAKFLDGKSNLKWTCYVEDGQHHAEVSFIGPKIEFHATSNSDSMYKTLDLVIDKLQRQVTKKKEKWKLKTD